MTTFIVIVIALGLVVVGAFAWFLHAAHNTGGGMAIIYPHLRDRKEEKS